MRIVLDIDETICSKPKVEPNNYELAEPYKDVIAYVNKLHDEGHYIIYFTARGMGTHDGNVGKAYNQWYSITEGQLDSWGAQYDELLLGKPYADIYIDDRALRISADGNDSVSIIQKAVEARKYGS